VLLDRPLRELPLRELPLRELPLCELLLRELPLRELPLRELPLRELPLRELPLRELPLRELPLRELLAVRPPPCLRPRADGTLAPSRRASERPIAIACLGSRTFLFERPEVSSPRFISCIARSTFLDAAGP
jgi:hypothetical protein